MLERLDEEEQQFFFAESSRIFKADVWTWESSGLNRFLFCFMLYKYIGSWLTEKVHFWLLAFTFLFIIPFFTLLWSIWQAPKLSQRVYTLLIFKPVCLTSTSSLAHISLASMTSESKMFLPSFELVSMKMALCKRGSVKVVVVKGISSNFQWVCLGSKVATCTREPSFHHPLHQHTFNMSPLIMSFTFGKKRKKHFEEKKTEKIVTSFLQPVLLFSGPPRFPKLAWHWILKNFCSTLKNLNSCLLLALLPQRMIGILFSDTSCVIDLSSGSPQTEFQNIRKSVTTPLELIWLTSILLTQWRTAQKERSLVTS